MMIDKNFKFVQPRFGILRNLNSATTKKGDLDSKYDDLWKHDEYIHALQFQQNEFSTDDLIVPQAPVPPNFLKALFHKKSIELYDAQYTDYEKKHAEYAVKLNKINEKNELIALYNRIKIAKKHICYFCGFQDPKFIEIHHINGDHNDNNSKNLQTACTLCHRQHHLLWLSVNDHAHLGAVNAKYINQAELNHLQRICLVYSKDSSELMALLGREGKLGNMLDQISNSFTRPLHAFMMPDSEKQKSKNEYRAKVKLRYTPTDKEENVDLICRALDALDIPSPTQTQLAEIGKLDVLIGVADLKKNEPNSTEEQLRMQALNSVREAIAKYDREYEIAFEVNFMNKTETFSLFELAMSLKTISVEDYKEFNPEYLFLIFKDGIFSDEQISEYKKMPYFDTTKWSFRNN